MIPGTRRRGANRHKHAGGSGVLRGRYPEAQVASRRDADSSGPTAQPSTGNGYRCPDRFRY